MNGPGILVLGSINIDLVIRVPRMPRPGETVLGGQFDTSLGGKGANQAVAAARAALADVTFLAAVGDDAHGREALATLAREARLLISRVKIFPAAATGVALITVDATGENMISVASGANALLTPAEVDEIPADVWRSNRVLLACLETPLPTVKRALERAREFGLTTILNPAPADVAAGAAEILELVDILTPNEHEAVQLACGSNDANSTIDAAQELCQRGAQTVIVTLGANGCAILSRASAPADAPSQRGEAAVTYIKPPQVQAIDTTAAGDSFSGALAVAVAEGRELVDAARWATAAAALSVTRRGAIPSLPTRFEIEATSQGNS